MATRLTIRFDFDAERRLGPGKVALLESIAQTGSISAAGRRHAMSYRRAWLLVEELNRTFGEALVTARPGGAGGGGAALTAAGERITALYRQAERKMRAAAADEIAGIEAALSREPLDLADTKASTPPAPCPDPPAQAQAIGGHARGKGKTRARLPSPRLRREAG
jgi:molybdate transport system regulatory protein